ncbi:MAG: DUF1700 domain-containing protein [Planctomycetota bacterium]|jgi:hypothetical protein
MNAEQQWQKLKNNYLKQVENALASTGQAKSSTILQDVNEHLERKYAELPADKLNWEGYQQILMEMGPPQDYAELLMEGKTPSAKSTSGINTFLAVIFVCMLAAVGSYWVYTAKKTPAEPLARKPFVFELDERTLGKWTTVDFVEVIDDFNPTQKSWQGELFLKELIFEDKSTLWWTNKDNEPRKHRWTAGKVDPLKERPSFYYLRNINQQTYLFFEWVTGDVTERGREPFYYVMKQTTDNKPLTPNWFENDPHAIGYWTSVDFVENIEDFRPEERKRAAELFLKTLRFEDNGKLWWTVGESSPIGLDWTHGKIRPFGVWPAVYSIKQIDGVDYLFYEYRTQQSKTAGYYVFKQTPQPESVEEPEGKPFENDPQVLGQWATVDFVETPDVFQPNQQSWRGEFWVKKLLFQEQGTVEWCLGEDQMKIDHQWTKGELYPDEALSAHYIIKRYSDGDYLFIEWISGDVTIRGQKPCYYVLSKKRKKTNQSLNTSSKSTTWQAG